MLKSKRLVTSLAVGTALMGAGLAVGVVQTQVAQPVTVQAKTKTKTIKIKKLIWKDGKWHNYTLKVPYGKTTVVKQPKYKGYKNLTEGEISNILVSKKGVASFGYDPMVFMKKISHKQQLKNAKSKKAVTVKGKLAYYTKSRTNIKHVKYTVKGLVGTMVTIKAPKVKGYKAKKVNIGIMGKNSGCLSWRPVHYVKK